MKKLQYLVTGMPRSGTVFTARFLTSIGIMCGHESIFNTEGLDAAIKKLTGQTNITLSNVSQGTWFDETKQIAESSYMSAPFLDCDCLAGCKIIHLVRNPIKVISSIYVDVNFFNDDRQLPWRNFVYEHLPHLQEIDNKLERTIAFYVWWNKTIEGKENIRIQVEKINPVLFDFLKVQPKDFFQNTRINNWGIRKQDLTLLDIPNGEIKDQFIEMTKKYGYK